jgi:hypothetical protein
MTQLTSDDIQGVLEVLREQIAARSSQNSTYSAGQPMLSEALELIATQAVLPVLVSVTSSQLQDLLKGRRLRALSLKEARALAEKTAGSPIAENLSLQPAERQELRQTLGPIGFNDNALEAMISEVSRRLSQREK